MSLNKRLYIVLSITLYLGLGYFLFFFTDMHEVQFKPDIATDSIDFIEFKKLLNSGSSKATDQGNLTPGSREIYDRGFSDKSKPTNDSAYTRIIEIVKPAAVAGTAYKGYLLTNSVKAEDVTKALMKNGVRRPFAEKYAESMTRFLKFKAVKRVFLAISVTGIVLSAEELLFPKLNFWQRMFIACSVGIIALWLFVILQRKGILY